MTLAQAIEQLRQTMEDYKAKRKRYLNDKDIFAMTIVITALYQKDRL